VEPDCGLIHGHKGPVLDVAFSPHNDHLLATGSDDSDIKLWVVPEEGLARGSSHEAAVLTLGSHTHAVRNLSWHPSASGVLLSASQDLTTRLWDVEKSADVVTIKEHTDVIYNCSFSANGDQFASCAAVRDPLSLRVWDSRSGQQVAAVQGHLGSKGQRVQWLTNSPGGGNLLLTTGFGRQSDREVKLWDTRQVPSEHCRSTCRSAVAAQCVERGRTGRTVQ
jgi:coronin-1B/1C/6